MRQSVESYAHRAAKQTVVGWLRDAARGREDQYVEQRRAARDSLPPKIRALVPDPDHDRVYAIAGDLGRAVGRAMISASSAYAALALAALELPDGEELLPEAWACLIGHARWHVRERGQTKRQIGDVLLPLIRQHRPRNALLAEAHGVNGTRGFLLTEDEVNETAAEVVWESLPRAPWSRRRGP